MNPALEALLAELEAFGETNDRTVSDRSQKMLNITRDTGRFLSVLVHATAARRILEIGTSNGYSTLWLAMAAQAVGGHVTTVEQADDKIALARQTFVRAGLEPFIHLVHDDAGRFITRLDGNSIDLLFLDSKRTDYAAWWPELQRVLRPRGLLIVDNAIAHPEEVAPFVKLVESSAAFQTSVVPLGKGEFLAVKSAAV